MAMRHHIRPQDFWDYTFDELMLVVEGRKDMLMHDWARFKKLAYSIFIANGRNPTPFEEMLKSPFDELEVKKFKDVEAVPQKITKVVWHNPDEDGPEWDFIRQVNEKIK